MLQWVHVSSDVQEPAFSCDPARILSPPSPPTTRSDCLCKSPHQSQGPHWLSVHRPGWGCPVRSKSWTAPISSQEKWTQEVRTQWLPSILDYEWNFLSDKCCHIKDSIRPKTLSLFSWSMCVSQSAVLLADWAAMRLPALWKCCGFSGDQKSPYSLDAALLSLLFCAVHP